VVAASARKASPALTRVVQLEVSAGGRPATQAIVRTFHAFSVLAQHSQRHSRHGTAASGVLRLWPRSVLLPICVVELVVSAAGRPATQAMIRTFHAFSVVAEQSKHHSRHGTAESRVLRLWPRSVLLPIRVVQLAVSAAGRPATQAMVRTFHAFFVVAQHSEHHSRHGLAGSRVLPL